MSQSGGGHRIPCSTAENIPEIVFQTQTEFHDVEGHPVYVASALMEGEVCPCKCVPHLDAPCLIPYGGIELKHQGRYDILPITRDMEWVTAANGRLPRGRTPVQGGCSSDGTPIYHAYTGINGVKVPGKTAPHLGGANIPFAGLEKVFTDHYYILCWRKGGYWTTSWTTNYCVS